VLVPYVNVMRTHQMMIYSASMLRKIDAAVAYPEVACTLQFLVNRQMNYLEAANIIRLR
jgi:hypothetical protein